MLPSIINNTYLIQVFHNIIDSVNIACNIVNNAYEASAKNPEEYYALHSIIHTLHSQACNAREAYKMFCKLMEKEDKR